MSKFTSEKQKLLQTLSRFDNGDLTIEDVTEFDSDALENKNHTLLLHVLLEMVCTMFEKDAEKRLVLFNRLCRGLTQTKWIDTSIPLDRFISLRQEKASEFFKCIKEIHSTIVPNISQDIHYLQLEDVSFTIDHLKYEETFEQLEVIGKGGFGKVFKARHNVDGIIYAVKKIVFKYRSDSDYVKVAREVRNIASLNNLNVVSYNNAWVQSYKESESDTSVKSNKSSPDTPDNQKRNEPRKHLPKPKCVKTLQYHTENGFSQASGDSFIIFKESSKNNSGGFQGNSNKETFWSQNSDTDSSSSPTRQVSSQDSDDSFIEFKASNSHIFQVDCDNNCKEDCSKEIAYSKSTLMAANSSTSHSSLPKCASHGHQDRHKDTFHSKSKYTMSTVFWSNSASSSESSSSDSQENSSECDFKKLKHTARKKFSSSQASFCESTSKTSFESKSNWNFIDNFKIVLYIQMEYCDCDLRLWLDKRAAGKPLPFQKTEIEIFKDILNGVAHIHTNAVIHRDLKPQNIFYSAKDNVMKIGDFGLATLGTSSPERLKGHIKEHSSDLGTLPYAAPEQRRKRIYDTKVDIYSLGIIFIELLLPFTTQMQFSQTVNDIVKGQIPKELKDKGPDYVALVQNLVQINPSDRMTAKDILNLPFLQDKNEFDKSIRIKDLEERLHEKDQLLFEKNQILLEKDRMLLEKDEIIQRLTQRLKETETKCT